MKLAKNLLPWISGAIVTWVADYSLLADWQAWVLVLWFVVATVVVQEATEEEIATRMRGRIDRISEILGRRR